MDYKESIETYLSREYLSYSLLPFQFGEYYFFLYQLIGNKEKELPTDLILKLNKLFVCANLLDDIMDEDNEDIEKIDNLNDEFPMYLRNLFSSIESELSKKEYLAFIVSIANSLHYQNIENKSRLTIEITENNYFSLYVKRSVFLLQAAVPFIENHDLNALYISTKYLAYFGQIKNDIADLRGPKSKDLLDNRPTLPLIKAISHAIKEGNDEIINLILTINEKNYSHNSYGKILRFINEREILEQCAKLSLFFFDKARKELIIHFPEKKDYIDSFFTKLIAKDV